MNELEIALWWLFGDEYYLCEHEHELIEEAYDSLFLEENDGTNLG